MSVILGLNAYHAGASAAILIDGQPVAAIAEERLNRVKYYALFPALAVQKCLDMAGLKLKDIDYLAVGRDRDANKLHKAAYALKNPTSLPDLLAVSAKRSVKNDLKTIIGSQGRGVRRADPSPHPPFEPCMRFSRTRLTDGLSDMVTLLLDSGQSPGDDRGRGLRTSPASTPWTAPPEGADRSA